jgi:hypothetical protein
LSFGILVDATENPGYEPGVLYVRVRGETPSKYVKASEVACADYEICCGARSQGAYGLGAPCGGFASWGYCLEGCGKCVWFIADVEDEEDIEARRPSQARCTVCGRDEDKHGAGGGEPHAFDPMGGRS